MRALFWGISLIVNVVALSLPDRFIAVFAGLFEIPLEGLQGGGQPALQPPELQVLLLFLIQGGGGGEDKHTFFKLLKSVFALSRR